MILSISSILLDGIRHIDVEGINILLRITRVFDRE